MNKHTTKYVLLIVILAIIALFLWRSGFNDSGVLSGGSLSKELTAELGEAEVYKQGENNFTFSYPQKLNVTETPLEGIEGGKIILAESGEAKKGFEVVILPFDESDSLTKERILQDVPDKVIKNEKKTTVGEGIEALAFESEDKNIGPTFEIWFVQNGYIYEARTYPEFGPEMQEILKTWKFK